jgi:hypothetical protein
MASRPLCVGSLGMVRPLVAKKTAKGSVFKTAADRLNQVRDEKERYQRAVDDSEAVEKLLRELTAKRGSANRSGCCVQIRRGVRPSHRIGSRGD